MARYENNRSKRYPYEPGNITSNSWPYDRSSDSGRDSGNAWRRVDEQRGGKRFGSGERNYSGYYGDANWRESSGQNRFGSGRPNQYQDNRYLDHDDNFINHEISTGEDRNIGKQEGWQSDFSNYRSNMGSYGLNSNAGLNRSLRGDYADRKGPYFGKGPKGWKRSDERIMEEVCEALYRSSEVDASELEVSVKDGVVFLTGTVENRKMKREAERCVEDLQGVQDVLNQLKLKTAEKAAEITGNAINGQDKRASLS